MILQDQISIWATTPHLSHDDGQIAQTYVQLRSLRANVQVLSQELSWKAYGQVVEEAVAVRTDQKPDLQAGDQIYLAAPASDGTVSIDDVDILTYPPGDYVVDRVQAAYVGGCHVQNPTVVTARKGKP